MSIPTASVRASVFNGERLRYELSAAHDTKAVSNSLRKRPFEIHFPPWECSGVVRCYVSRLRDVVWNLSLETATTNRRQIDEEGRKSCARVVRHTHLERNTTQAIENNQ